LLVAYAGFQSLVSMVEPFQDNDWWMKTFHVRLQFSTFSTLLLWVPHHLVAAMSLLLAYFVLESSARRGTFLVGCLLASALFSSAFVSLGAAPYVLMFSWYRRERLMQFVLSGLVGTIIGLPMLWMYLIRRPQTGFTFLPVAPFLPVAGHSPALGWLWAFFVCFLLAGLQFILQGVCLYRLARYHQLLRWEVVGTVASMAIVVSTFVIGYGASNQYTLRVPVVPMMFLALVCSKAARLTSGLATYVCLAVLAFGSIQEVALFNYRAVEGVLRPYADVGVRRAIFKLNTSETSSTALDAIGKAAQAEARYLIERPWVSRMAIKDAEIEGSGPFGIWKYQRWQPQ